ncbi:MULTISPECIES: hypothetical protein [Bacillus cereus group]|uniref:hypothetical protein n=1 Tax=Bacillus cereus group TaxID=86661 RepID=UPI0002790119|nr:hypothetical protein [Bacillus paranthracis]EJQ03663.1 hypothetical protein IC5_02809 [Bacillus cereus AND1407]KMP84712.1 hypothetical protein TU64_12500 [Bacillus cereus]KMQ32826.1 hypothetical protein TU69_05800 [Bacillus cereus]MBE7133909.1 hypothetical protein [Bacillus paranthracis]MCC2359127.1 hypothetical protein [Bacillus paranthracis]
MEKFEIEAIESWKEDLEFELKDMEEIEKSLWEEIEVLKIKISYAEKAATHVENVEAFTKGRIAPLQVKLSYAEEKLKKVEKENEIKKDQVLALLSKVYKEIKRHELV